MSHITQVTVSPAGCSLATSRETARRPLLTKLAIFCGMTAYATVCVLAFPYIGSGLFDGMLIFPALAALLCGTRCGIKCSFVAFGILIAIHHFVASLNWIDAAFSELPEFIVALALSVMIGRYFTVSAALRSTLHDKERMNQDLLAAQHRLAEQSKEELNQKEAHMQFIIDQMPAVVWVTGRDMKFRSCPGVGKTALGVSREKILGMHLTELLGTDDPNADPIKAHRLALNGQIAKFSYSYDAWQYDVVVAPYRGRNGAIDGVLGIAFDVSERAKLEEALYTAQIESSRADRAKREFLANISHEIRTPLGVIVGFSELTLGQRGKDDAVDPIEALLTIHRNAEQLSRLVDDLLDLASSESESFSVAIDRVDIASLLQDLRASFAPLAERKGISLTVEVEEAATLATESDRMRLQQVIGNLVGNAIKFTDEGGVTVRAFSEPESGVVTIEIEDTGVGISTEFRSNLFKTFAQADASTSRRHGGTGLGLALSKRLAQKLGGDLKLQHSERGVGTTFALTLPRAFPEDITIDLLAEIRAANRVAPEVVTLPVLKALRVLVVEDHRDNQEMIRTILEAEGAQVDVADSGQGAVEKALSQPFDAVLMDLQMPGMSGAEATCELRARGAKVPIIALTAHAMKGSREAALENGFDDYLTKPVVIPALLESLGRFARIGSTSPVAR